MGLWTPNWLRMVLRTTMHSELGEAEAILATAEATTKGIATVSQTLKEYGGVEYIQAFNEVAMKGKTLLLPATSAADPAAMIAVALCVYKASMCNDSITELPGTSAKQNVASVTGDVMKYADVKPLALTSADASRDLSEAATRLDVSDTSLISKPDGQGRCAFHPDP